MSGANGAAIVVRDGGCFSRNNDVKLYQMLIIFDQTTSYLNQVADIVNQTMIILKESPFDSQVSSLDREESPFDREESLVDCIYLLLLLPYVFVQAVGFVFRLPDAAVGFL